MGTKQKSYGAQHVKESKRVRDIIFSRRGEVIDATTILESFFDEIILNYFIKDAKKKQFLHSVLGKEYYSFSNKAELIMFIIKQVDENFYSDHKREDKKGALNYYLKEIKDYRNDIAHRKFDYTTVIVGGGDTYKLKKITTDKHEPILKPIDITEARVKIHNEYCEKATVLLKKLILKIK